MLVLELLAPVLDRLFCRRRLERALDVSDVDDDFNFGSEPIREVERFGDVLLREVDLAELGGGTPESRTELELKSLKHLVFQLI